MTRRLLYRSRRDPATRVAGGGRRAYLSEQATQLDIRPTLLASLWRRRRVKDPRTGRWRPIPPKATIPISAIDAVRFRPARWWLRGKLVVEATGHGDPWLWLFPGRPFRLTWWWSPPAWRPYWWGPSKAHLMWTLHKRLHWVRDMALIRAHR